MQDLTSHLQQNDSDLFSNFILFYFNKINHNITCKEFANVENVHTWNFFYNSKLFLKEVQLLSHSNIVCVFCDYCVSVVWVVCEWCVSGVWVVCECYLSVKWVLCGCFVDCVGVFCDCCVTVVWVWCVNVVCECGVWVWCVSVVCKCGGGCWWWIHC